MVVVPVHRLPRLRILCPGLAQAVVLLGIVTASLAPSTARAESRSVLNFNPDWKFIQDDPRGAQAPDFNDGNWTTVSAPHTYNDVDTFDDWSINGHKGEQNQWGGRTWYRKAFDAPAGWKGKKVYIEFEAVRQVAEVYLNGKLLGTAKTGFTPFGFDLTPGLKIGEKNLIAVMCDNRFMKDPLNEGSDTGKRTAGGGRTDPGPSGGLAALSAKVNDTIPENIEDLQADQIPWNNPHWHPAHGGMYRNVRLYVLDPLHISLPLYSFLQTAGPYVYASDITNDSATVNVEVPIENDRAEAASGQVSVDVLDEDGKSVLNLKHDGEADANGKGVVTVSGRIANPKLWEPAYPYLYKVVCTLTSNGQAVDSCEIPLGIRSVKWTVDCGFYINGHHLKLHGWGQKPTDEWPGLGAAQPDWMHFFTLNLMKQAGGNIIRWGHCAGGMTQIKSGDELGIIAEQPGVDGESDTVRAAWKLRAMAWRDMVIYFRNNPSILIWEGGNQKVTREHAKELHDYVLKYDPHGGRAYAHRRADKTDAEFMDIGIGTEGGQEIKELPVVEGEYDREESPRRVWDDKSPPNFGYPEAKGMTYDLTSEEYAVNQVSQWMKKCGSPAHCGGSNWIFSDSTSGGRVPAEVARAGGEVDGVRLPKEAYYVCAAMFRTDPQVHIIGHWSYPPNTKKNVYVASNADDVELFVNGKSLRHGKRSERYLFTFPDVSFEPGEIKAVASNGAAESKHTVGKPVALKMTPITGPGGLQANGSDVVLIDVEAVDEKGDRCPTFEQRVDFETEGPGIWRGGYNSGRIKSINNTYLNLECGINRVAMRSTLQAGAITVRARSDGLKDASLTVNSVATDLNKLPTIPSVSPQQFRDNKAFGDTMPVEGAAMAQAAGGKFVKSFSYSGASGKANVVSSAADGAKAYADTDATITSLPDKLKGADFIQASNADNAYSAVDLMEIAVKGGTTVYVAHDQKLPKPEWLTRQFKPTDMTVTVGGKSMTLFSHKASKDQSLTLGSNSEDAEAKESNMYVVFVQGG